MGGSSGPSPWTHAGSPPRGSRVTATPWSSEDGLGRLEWVAAILAEIQNGRGSAIRRRVEPVKHVKGGPFSRPFLLQKNLPQADLLPPLHGPSVGRVRPGLCVRGWVVTLYYMRARHAPILELTVWEQLPPRASIWGDRERGKCLFSGKKGQN